MIIRNEYKGELALGRRIKTTAVASFDTITEFSQTVADVVTTARSAVELIHGSLQPAIMEQRIEYATTAQQGLKTLMENGMTEEEACTYLQIPYTKSTSTKSTKTNASAVMQMANA
jgi:hypothetical protein